MKIGKTILESNLEIFAEVEMCISYNPFIPLIDLYSKEILICVHKETRASMSIWCLKCGSI